MVVSKRVTGAPAFRIIGRVFLGIGLLVLTIAVVFAAIELTSRRTAHAEATVVSVSNSRPWVRFSSADGREAQFRGWVRNPSWEVGDHTAVVFDPQKPSDAQIDGIGGRWFLPFLFGLLGGIFTVLGAGFAIAGRLAGYPPRLTTAQLRIDRCHPARRTPAWVRR